MMKSKCEVEVEDEKSKCEVEVEERMGRHAAFGLGGRKKEEGRVKKCGICRLAASGLSGRDGARPSHKRVARKTAKTALLISSLLLLTCSQASVPLRWTVEASRVAPVVFEAYHGETLALEASFKDGSKALEMPLNGCCLMWQTNGMGSAWWQVPAAVSTNRVSATFTPAMDPGAAAVTGFLGATGQNYRAAFTLRFRHGPGAAPNALEPPVRTLDFASVTVANAADAPFALKGQGGGGCDTNAVSAIITNHVASGYLCTVAAAGTLVTNATIALRDDVASAAITNAGAVAAAAASAAAAYLPLAGGTLAGNLTAKNVITRKVTFNDWEFEMFYGAEGMNFLDYNSGCSSFLVPDDSNVATSNMVERMSDYALTGGAVLKSGEIAAIETATNLTVTLDFDDNGRGADCGAYVENTAASNVTLTVAGDFHVACAGDAPLTLPKSSTNLVWFCRVKTNVVVVSRSEIK